ASNEVELRDILVTVSAMPAAGLANRQKPRQLLFVEAQRRRRDPSLARDLGDGEAGDVRSAHVNACPSGSAIGTHRRQGRTGGRRKATGRSNGEGRPRDHRMELPNIFVKAAKKIDRHLIARLDRDGFLPSLDYQIFLGERY